MKVKVEIWAFIVFILFSLKITAQKSCDTVLFDKAYGYMQRQSYDSAIKTFSLTIKNCPSFTVAYLNRGICYYIINEQILA